MKTEKTIMQKIADARRKEWLDFWSRTVFTEDERDIILSRAATPEEAGKAKSAHQILADERQRKGIQPGGALSGGIPHSVAGKNLGYSNVVPYSPWEEVGMVRAKTGARYLVETKKGGQGTATYSDSGDWHWCQAYPSLINDVVRVMEIPE